jgi:hypothetical protein
MGLATGLGLLAIGLVLVLVALPRRGEDMRPWLRSSLAQVAYPSICLVFIAMGAATTATNIP